VKSALHGSSKVLKPIGTTVFGVLFCRALIGNAGNAPFLVPSVDLYDAASGQQQVKGDGGSFALFHFDRR
jgi:hypothetical protein